MSSVNEPKGELESWKEIADFLGVNPRTAQKWEKERALPVQRFGGKRGRVATTRQELAEWKRHNLNGLPWWSNVSVLRAYSLAVSGLLAAALIWYAAFGGSSRQPGAAASHSARELEYLSGYPDPSRSELVDRVKVGLLPDRVVVSSDGSRAYVANEASSRVSVISMTTSPPDVIATVRAGLGPHGLAVSPDDAFVYVPNNGDGTVSVIETAGNRIVATLDAGIRPRVVAFSPDGSKAYVTARGGTVSVFGTATHQKLDVLDLGGQPYGILLTEDGARAYVSQRSNGAVAVVDTSKLPLSVMTYIAVGQQPLMLAKTPDGRKMYLSNRLSDCVSVIDPATNSVRATIPVGDGPYYLTVTPDGRRLYVANQHSDSISIIDTESDTVLTSIDTIVDSPRGLAIAKMPSGAASSDEFMLLGTGGSATLYTTSF